MRYKKFLILFGIVCYWLISRLLLLSEDPEFLSYESFRSRARFAEPTDCDTYLSQTDTSSQDLWEFWTGHDIHTPINRVDLSLNVAFVLKSLVSPGEESIHIYVVNYFRFF